MHFVNSGYQFFHVLIIKPGLRYYLSTILSSVRISQYVPQCAFQAFKGTNWVISLLQFLYERCFLIEIY